MGEYNSHLQYIKLVYFYFIHFNGNIFQFKGQKKLLLINKTITVEKIILFR